MIYRRIFCFLIACFFGYQSAYAADPQPLDLSKPVNPNSVKRNPAILDLEVFPRLSIPQQTFTDTSTSLGYTTKDDPKHAYKFNADLLKTDQWLELPGSTHDEDADYRKSTFERDGYRLQLTVNKITIKPEKVEVSLKQLGNIDPKSIPKLADARVVVERYEGIGFTTSVKMDDAIAATQKLLLADGWQQYGNKQGYYYIFKKGRILLELRSSITRIENETKNGISYQLQMTPADLPVPAVASMQYNPFHSSKFIMFSNPGTTEEMLTFYQAELPKLGWKQSTEISRRKNEYRFRNTAKDLICVQIYTSPEKQTIVRLEHFSAKRAREQEEQETIRDRIKN